MILPFASTQTFSRLADHWYCISKDVIAVELYKMLGRFKPKRIVTPFLIQSKVYLLNPLSLAVASSILGRARCSLSGLRLICLSLITIYTKFINVKGKSNWYILVNYGIEKTYCNHHSSDARRRTQLVTYIEHISRYLK